MVFLESRCSSGNRPMCPPGFARFPMAAPRGFAGRSGKSRWCRLTPLSRVAILTGRGPGRAASAAPDGGRRKCGHPAVGGVAPPDPPVLRAGSRRKGTHPTRRTLYFTLWRCASRCGSESRRPGGTWRSARRGPGHPRGRDRRPPARVTAGCGARPAVAVDGSWTRPRRTATALTTARPCVPAPGRAGQPDGPLACHCRIRAFTACAEPCLVPCGRMARRLGPRPSPLPARSLAPDATSGASPGRDGRGLGGRGHRSRTSAGDRVHRLPSPNFETRANITVAQVRPMRASSGTDRDRAGEGVRKGHGTRPSGKAALTSSTPARAARPSGPGTHPPAVTRAAPDRSAATVRRRPTGGGGHGSRPPNAGLSCTRKPFPCAVLTASHEKCICD